VSFYSTLELFARDLRGSGFCVFFWFSSYLMSVGKFPVHCVCVFVFFDLSKVVLSKDLVLFGCGVGLCLPFICSVFFFFDTLVSGYLDICSLNRGLTLFSFCI